MRERQAIRKERAVTILKSCPVLIAGISAALTVTGPATAQLTSSHASADTLQIHLAPPTDWSAVPFHLDQGDILLDASINGQPEVILFDNGTARTVIDQGIATKLGIVLGKGETELTTGFARLATKQAQNVSMTFPHVLTLSGSMPAVDLGPVSKALGRPIAAILGGDVIGRLAVFVQGKAQKIAILRTSEFQIKGPVVRVLGRSSFAENAT